HPPAELRRDHVVVAAPRHGSPDKRLVRQRPVQLPRIDEVDAKPERPPDRLHTFRPLSPALEPGHTHPTPTHRPHLEITKLPLIQAPPLLSGSPASPTTTLAAHLVQTEPDDQRIVQPPSTGSVCPVISDAAGEQRKTTAPATSSGSPIRCSAAIRSS